MARSVDPRITTGVLSLSGMVGALNGTLVIPLLPVLPPVLGVSGDDVSWLITITLVTGAVSIPAVSRLADMYGRRTLMIVCLVVMGAGAILSATASGFGMMLVGRALAGLGVPLIPIGISVVRDAVPRERVGTAVALMSATTGIGAALGLPLAGILFESWGWRSVFWLTAIVSLGLAAAVVGVVPRTRIGTGGRFDFPGALLLATATACAVLLISQGAVWGWGSGLSIGMFVVGLGALVLWIFIELRIRDPLVDLRTSSSRPVFVTNVAALLVGIVLLINLLLAMQQLQAPVETGYGLGLGVLEATLVLLPSSLLLVALAPINGVLLNRLGGRPVLISGLIVMALGYVCRLVLHDNAWDILIAATVVSIGSGFAYAAMPTIIMRSVPDEMTAAANGLNALLRQIGTASSSAIVAGAIAAGAVVVNGATYPAWSTIVALDVFAVIVSLVAAALAVLIPRRS